MTAKSLGLAVTTSTGVTGVAVGPLGAVDGGDGLTSSRVTTTDRRHAEELTPLILDVLAEQNLAVSDLDVLIADIGPGRFTGLRVGLATVRALAFASDIPVVGLTSLEILAGGVGDTDHVTAVIDARRNEVFQQVFSGGKPERQPDVGPAATLVASASGLVIGDGADLYCDIYEGPESGLAIAAGRNPDPVVMLSLGAGRKPTAGRAIVPLYLRDPDVNPNVKTRPVADRHGGNNGGSGINGDRA